MKKRVYLLLIAAMLLMLTACSPGQKEESEMPGEHTVSESGSGTEELESGTGAEQEISGAEAGADGTETSGENAESAEYEYEKTTIYYSEFKDKFSIRKDVEKTQTDYAAYYFEPSIGRQERNTYIEATERMLACIDGDLPYIEVTVLKPESYDGISFSGNHLYLPHQPWDSVDYLAKVLLAGYGEWGNYGLAYGYADYLSKKAGMDSRKTDSEAQEAKELLPMSAPELYDLNLLCFDEKFVSPEDVEASKNNACLFVEDYLSSHSEAEFLELLSASGTAEGAVRAKEALEAFYAENGIECSLSEMRYQYGGAAFDYMAACEYARFYIEKDWQDWAWDLTPLVSENFLHENYGEVREFFECNRQQMRQYQEHFGFGSYNDDLSILLTNSRGLKTKGTMVSYYYESEHTIYLKSVVTLMHEYIHSLMHGRIEKPDVLWKTEGFAAYFDPRYNLYRYSYQNDVLNSDSRTWIQEYIAEIGRPIDIRMDSCALFDIEVYACGYKDPNSSYGAGASFISYLIGQYGEQAVIAYLCDDNEYNAEWGKSYEKLVQDWNRYIEENYSQYSTNAGQ